jgi:hypothetical protein
LCQELAQQNGHLDALVTKVEALDADLAPQFQQIRDDAPNEVDALLSAVRTSDDPLEFVRDASNLLANVGNYWDLGTPALVADLVAGLVGPGTAIYDPTIGTGHLVTRVARKESGDVAIYGQDINAAAAALATSVLEAAGYDSHIMLGDAIAEDRHKGLLADVVVAHPPFGMQLDANVVDPDDIRWTFGTPRGDTAWLQIGLHHLAPGGRMAILVPPRMLFQQGSEAGVLQRIIRQNLLRAIIALPDRSLAPSAIAPAILLLGDGWGTQPSGTSQPILMVDIEAFRQPNARGSVALTHEGIQQVIGNVRTWLDGDTQPDVDGINPVTYDDIVENDWVLLPHRYQTDTRKARIFSVEMDLVEDMRENLGDVVNDLAERVQQYVGREYDGIRTTGVPTTLGELDDVTLFPGVAAQDVLDMEMTNVTVIEPADLKGIPVATRFWDGERGTLLEVGDVLIKLQSPNLGESALFDGVHWASCVAGPGVGVIRVGKLANVTAEYLAAWCASPAFRREAERLAVGSVRKRLRFPDLASIPIALPDLETQQVLGERARAVAEIERLLPQLEFDLGEFAGSELHDIAQSVEPDNTDNG